jgi:hypothetical protein
MKKNPKNFPAGFCFENTFVKGTGHFLKGHFPWYRFRETRVATDEIIEHYPEIV